jgi:hypothetical protein
VAALILSAVGAILVCLAIPFLMLARLTGDDFNKYDSVSAAWIAEHRESCNQGHRH